MFLPSRGGSQGGHVSSFETGGGALAWRVHWHGGSIGMGGGVVEWAKWLPQPCRIGDPHRFRAGGKIRSGPQVGKVATSPLPYRRSPPLQSGGQNQKWPTSGRNGYLTPAVSGIPTASERRAESEVAHKWAKWLPHPCRIGDPVYNPHRFRAGGRSPAHLNSCPTSTRTIKNPLPWKKKVMWK